MALNNSNKRNLFEMKSQANKYAQLVEAQSPEPPDSGLTQADKTLLAGSSASLSVTAEPVLSRSGCQNEAQNPTKPDSARKESQCSSQECNSSFVSSSAPDTSYIPMSSSAESAPGEPSLSRTISQSMLELDSSARLSKFQVSWRNLSFSYQSSWASSCGLGGRQPAPVLCDISGSFRSNQLVAVIGPSGCGKTTLLQFLAGNNPSQCDQLKITGLEAPRVAYIGQHDCLLPGLTARETLMYASRLQNSSSPNFDHQAHIEPILSELGLLECADRLVTKLSGGQAKRVTIAQELLYPTNLLILDEVTSGLDASTSHAIVKLLSQLVADHEYPMSIVMSIHQPSARLFAIFDQVYVMSAGCCLYEGGCKVDLVNAHLARFKLECPKFHNIADYLIEIASEVVGATAGAKEQLIQYQRKRCLVQEEPAAGFEPVAANGSSLEQLKSDCGLRVPMLATSASLYAAVAGARSRRHRSALSQLSIHFSRSLLRISRSYILTYIQLLTYILLGLQLATFYGPDIGLLDGCPGLPLSFMAFVFSNDSEEHQQRGTSDMSRIQENMNFLLVAIMTTTFAALEITVITFPLEARTIKREWRNGWYRVSSYFIGRTLADLPFQLTFVVIFCFVIYTLTGQLGLASWRFGSFVTIMVMTALIAQTVGFIFGALFMDNLPAAVFTAPLCIFPALLFSGFFSRASQVPSFYKPMTYISHFKYAFDALIVTLYGFDRCNCDQELLEAYHASKQNQTSSVRDLFVALFGGAECGPSAAAGDENSIEDLTTVALRNASLLSTTTAMPPARTLQTRTLSSLEDALVNSVFDHMKNASAPPETHDAGAMDHLAHRFSNRITMMLNRQSNFGHEIPAHCKEFNSYMMTEFDLHNDDLIFGLMMLFLVVLMSRFICNSILTFTIARRAH